MTVTAVAAFPRGTHHFSGQRRWRSIAREGVRDIMPLVVSVVPLAMAIGAAVGASSVTTTQGLVSAVGILAGAAQLTTIEMLDNGSAVPIIILSGLMINARILVYSATIAPWFRGESLRRRMLLALPVIDQMYFICVPRFERGDLDARGRRAYYTGAGVCLVGSWIAAQALAIGTISHLPPAAGLHVAAPIALAGLLAKSTGDRPSVIAAVVAASIAAFGGGLPLHSSVLVAIVAGTAVASLPTHRKIEQ